MSSMELSLLLATLGQWYNNDTGLWESTGWWNSANILTTLTDFDGPNTSFRYVYNNTFVQAPLHNPTVVKVRTPYLTDSYTTLDRASQGGNITLDQASHGSNTALDQATRGFKNEYYDDEGWWALAWLTVYENTHERPYFETAVNLYEDMIHGYNATCGGIWWDKGHQHNTAIANELFLAVAARLAVLSSTGSYSRLALQHWKWFQRSGFITADYTISDGLDLNTCQPEHGIKWTYTHGVILGALIDLHALFQSSNYLVIASKIAYAAIHHFTDSAGILHEPCEPNCGADGPQFKGIFVRNLQRLQQVVPDPTFKRFIETNAHAIWNFDRKNGRLGLVWSGPYMVATASTHSSACDALIAESVT